MKLYLILLFVLISQVVVFAQDKIIAVGAGLTFVEKDSTTVSFSFDLNRVPGKTEAGGTFFIKHKIFKNCKYLGRYLKPTADVNLGSSTTASPNNVSFGVPFGLAYDFKTYKGVIHYIGFEIGPDGVADKEFKNFLYYGTALTYFKASTKINVKSELNLVIGSSISIGERSLIDSSRVASYGRFTLPIALQFSGFHNDEADFFRVKFSTIYKGNCIFSDDRVLNPAKNFSYLTLKFDYFFTKNFGLNISYLNGSEEPLFKRNHTLTMGISLAR